MVLSPICSDWTNFIKNQYSMISCRSDFFERFDKRRSYQGSIRMYFNSTDRSWDITNLDKHRPKWVLERIKKALSEVGFQQCDNGEGWDIQMEYHHPSGAESQLYTAIVNSLQSNGFEFLPDRSYSSQNQMCFEYNIKP